MNSDFRDLLSALSAAGAEFLVVGAQAVAVHAIPRATGDLDVWVGTHGQNPQRVWNALTTFGAPLHELTVDDLRHPELVFQLGVPPVRIDILTSVDGVDFERCWPKRLIATFEGLDIPVIGIDDLIANKRAAGRPQDLVDVELLTRMKERSSKGV